ncbi:Y-family DNA polymerase [Spiribacter onubensis]|uniref:DNA polymerase Y family protein n=1 Tax=Spiribacter onubensis TaxID=3122420 RepID=A0ABV3S8A4_9GAMM
MLWLCLHFYHLPVECFSGDRDAEQPLFISEAGRIIGCNHQARRHGIQPDMTPTAARALVAHGHHHVRDLERERHVLERLATWAGRFSPRVSLQAPAALLLEIEGSLRYFQGLEPLRQRILEGIRQLGHRITMGIAPTPTAAWLLARAGDETPVTARKALGPRLSGLSVAILPVEQRMTDALHGLGCETIGDIRALPRAGATRRLGQGLLEMLQRAHGERPDPRENWQPPASFDRQLQLMEATTDLDMLRPELQRLIDGLCISLRRHDAGVRRLRFALHHRQGRPTLLPVGVLAPCRDAGHLRWLLDRRLDGLTLSGDVTAIHLRAGRFHPMPGTSTALDLLDEGRERNVTDDWHRLVETLNSRLGEARVHRLAIHSEHRPEKAWAYHPPGSALQQKAVPATVARPCWLLKQPVLLKSPRGKPEYEARPLLLEDGPERIETGWWDGHDVTRDYYRARTRRGQRVWIFRDRRGQRHWYLHGIFA